MHTSVTQHSDKATVRLLVFHAVYTRQHAKRFIGTHWFFS